MHLQEHTKKNVSSRTIGPLNLSVGEALFHHKHLIIYSGFLSIEMKGRKLNLKIGMDTQKTIASLLN